MDAKAETWCDRAGRKLFEYYVDFNDWLDGDQAARVREVYKVDGISVPSKAFYAGDKAAYDQAFKEYRRARRHEVLNEHYLCEQFADNHWFERNLQRFDQLLDRLKAGDVVPFIDAGLSKGGGSETRARNVPLQFTLRANVAGQGLSHQAGRTRYPGGSERDHCHYRLHVLFLAESQDENQLRPRN
jgi:hypothetical protein